MNLELETRVLEVGGEIVLRLVEQGIFHFWHNFFWHILMIFQSGVNRSHSSIIKNVKNLAKNEEMPCLTCLKTPFFS